MSELEFCHVACCQIRLFEEMRHSNINMSEGPLQECLCNGCFERQCFATLHMSPLQAYVTIMIAVVADREVVANLKSQMCDAPVLHLVL